MNIVPRGLRVQIFPTWQLDQEFNSEWEKGLMQCSHILIDMLIEQDKTLLTQTRNRIKELEIQLNGMEQGNW